MTKTWTTHKHDQPGFSIERPAGWSVHPGLMGSAIAFVEPESDRVGGFASNVNVVASLPYTDVKDYLKRQLDGLQDALVDARILSTDVSDGRDLKTASVMCVYRQGNQDVQLRQLHVLHPERTYVVSATALADRFGQLLPVFDRMLGSFSP